MKLSVTIRDRRTGQGYYQEFDCYESKKELREDMNRNGFSVVGRVYAEGDEKTRLGNLYWNLGIK